MAEWACMANDAENSLELGSVKKLRFLGDQDGPPERELKSRLSELFRQANVVSRAFLARVLYGPNEIAVALCIRLRTDGAEENLAKEIAQIFSEMFGQHEHLDIVFLRSSQEADLLRVCRPFHTAMEIHQED